MFHTSLILHRCVVVCSSGGLGTTNIQAIGRWWVGAFKDYLRPLVINGQGRAVHPVLTAFLSPMMQGPGRGLCRLWATVVWGDAMEGSRNSGHPAGTRSPATDPMAGETWDAVGSLDASSE